MQAFYATGTLMAEREYEIKSNAPGYVSEAGVVLNRVTSALELAHLITQDHEQGTMAERFIAQVCAPTKVLPLKTL